MNALDPFARREVWVSWAIVKRGDRPTKVPFAIDGKPAKADDPSTWMTRAQAAKAARQNQHQGIGIMLAALDDGQHLGGIDLDACIDDDGAVASWAREILDLVPSYTEISPSGRGLKIYFLHDSRETLAAAEHWRRGVRRRATNGGKDHGIELYLERRYFAVTGQTFEDLDTMATVTLDRLQAVHEKMEAFQPRPKPKPRPASDHPRRHDSDVARLLDAIDHIPNHDLHWEEFNRIGMAIYAATGGSVEGHAAFERFSARSSLHEAAATEERWNNYRRSPPKQLSAGTIFHEARLAGWREPERPTGNGHDVPPPTEEPDVADPRSALDPGNSGGGAPPGDPIVERLRQMFDKPTGWVDPDHPPEIAAPMLEPMALAVFNYRFAMAFVGKHRYVFNKTKPLHFMSRGEFAAAWAGIKVNSRFGAEPKDVQRVALVKTWLAAIGADRYDEFVFRPNEGQPGGRAWNTAGSFIEAKEGPTPCFDAVMDLLLPDDREWFLDWLADLVQSPLRVRGTAVCITGPTRIGKSLLGNYIGRMLGSLYLLIESTVFAGRAFNAEEKDALLTHYDEAVASDLKNTLSIIKAKITSPTRRIEAKGIDAITIPNPMHYLLTSEHDPVPLMDGGTRSRFAILAMSSNLKGNRTFFDAFGAEMDGDGPAHLLHRLLNRKITHDLRIAPDTSAARRNAKDHLPPLKRWLVESVEEGCFVGGAPYKDKDGFEISNNAPWAETAHTPAIYAALVHWWKDRRLRDEVPSREAVSATLRSLGCTYQGRLRVSGSEKQGSWTLLTPEQVAANIKALWQIDLD